MTYSYTFGDVSNTTYHDWVTPSGSTGADYTSYLNTFYQITDDPMLWLQSPYVYVFVKNTDTWDDTKGLLMQGAFDWFNSNASHHWSAQEQVYSFRNNPVSAVRKKVRGKGKALQLRFTSVSGKDFNLLGWGIVIDKKTRP